ncbi:uncharacterized protein [Watersipora subatra]|uniref:uncharacterized protein n=1 Tax=Watersipora subatra TaxID=2589382 RepID=UPI00355B805B
MASEYQFLAPKSLAGVDLPAEWEVYKEDFTHFLEAIDKDGADDKVKIALLLRTVGERGKDIYKTFTYATGKSKDVYNDIIENFDNFCKPRRNLFNSRDHFFNCKQNHTSVDEYLTELRKRARYCEFGEQTETLILHTMVIGLDDAKTVAKIKQMENVELDNVVKMLRRLEEAAKCEQKEESVSIAAVRNNAQHRTEKPKTHQSSTCSRCGSSPRHSFDSCPAKGQICRNCEKPNHFEKCCYTPKRKARSQCNALFVGCIKSSTTNPADFTTNISINDTTVSVLLDTGAECNTLPVQLVNQMNLPVQKCATTLYSYSGHQLVPLGQVTATAHTNGKSLPLTFMVVPEDRRAVLGGKACVTLGLLAKLNQIQSPEEREMY